MENFGTDIDRGLQSKSKGRRERCAERLQLDVNNLPSGLRQDAKALLSTTDQAENTG